MREQDRRDMVITTLWGKATTLLQTLQQVFPDEFLQVHVNRCVPVDCHGWCTHSDPKISSCNKVHCVGFIACILLAGLIRIGTVDNTEITGVYDLFVIEPSAGHHQTTPFLPSPLPFTMSRDPRLTRSRWTC